MGETFEFGIGFIGSSSFASWNSPSNFRFIGTPEEAFKEHGDELWLTLEAFQKASMGEDVKYTSLILQARPCDKGETESLRAAVLAAQGHMIAAEL